MRDASEKGIARLYFCARDAHVIFLIAKRLKPLFPNIAVEFLYISQTALYNSAPSIVIRYFLQVGLASKDERTAIVDITSGGKTQYVINQLIEKEGYNTVRCYLFQLMAVDFDRALIRDCYAELDGRWLNFNKKSRRISSNWIFYELFFSLHTLSRTIGYREDKNHRIKPLFEDSKISYDSFETNDVRQCEIVHNELLQNYTDFFIDSKLYYYADSLFEGLALPSWADFLCAPKKYYLEPLKSFSACNSNGKMVPYVKRRPLLWLLDIKKKNVIWKRGTIAANLPQWLSDLLLRNR